MPVNDLQTRYARITQALRTASNGLYAPPKLIAVTKNHPVEEMLPLQALGVTDVGENRVQEMVEKLPEVRGKFNLHCIGRLQSNKVKYIIEDVCLIQSVDRMSLAREIDRQSQLHSRVTPILVQVSPAGEEQKGGVSPEALRPFLRELRQMPGLSVQGLMAVMPRADDEAYLDGLFAGMRTLFERVRDEAMDGIAMRELSMGMSGDCLIAARHGATMVRVGSALMGPRDYTK